MRPRRILSFLPFVPLAVLAGCNPNWEPGTGALDTPPEWKRPPMDGDDGRGGDPHAQTNGRPGMPSMASIVAELEKKIAADPKDLDSHRQLGQALSELGEWDRAAQVLLEAISLDPKDVSLRVLRARVLIQRRDQGAALAELEAAKKIAPDDEKLLRTWGSYYLMGEQMDEAVKVRKRLLAKHPGIDDAETIEREIYYLSHFPKLKDDGKLKEFFDTAGAAKVQAQAQRWDEAVTTLEKVLALVPDDPEHWSDLAVAQRKVGKKAEGIASFKKALSFDKNHSSARLGLARALSEDGDGKAAAAVLAEWQKIDAKRAKKYEADTIGARLAKGGSFDAVATAAAGSTGSTGKPGQAEAGAITGSVKLSPALAAKAPKSAALFVIAKSSPAERMPIAVKRMVGATFPAEFRISSAESMAGGELSGEVYLSARIEVDGRMGSGPGDLEGLLVKPVQVGAGGVELVIDTEVGASGGGGHAVATPQATPAAPGNFATGAAGFIRGTIEIDPKLSSRVTSGARLYIFAKGNKGPGPPLAVVNLPMPSKFPFDFELSESNTMMPGMPFEGSLWLTARIDQDGSAGGAAGDLEGMSKAPVPVGTAGVALTIDTVR